MFVLTRVALGAAQSALSRAKQIALGTTSSMPDRTRALLNEFIEHAGHHCATPAQAQSLADVAGCAATSLDSDGLREDSQLLRTFAHDVLSDLLDKWGPPEKCMRAGKSISLFEQLLVRSLEIGGLQGSALALELAVRGAAFAEYSQEPLAAKRFRAAGRIASLHSAAAAKIAAQEDARESVEPHLLFQCVDRLEGLELGQFLSLYSCRQRPVVIKSKPVDLAPVWGLDDLVRLCGDRKVQLQRREQGWRGWAEIRSLGMSTFGELVERWRAGDSESLLFDEPLRLACPALLEYLPFPSLLVACNLFQQAPCAGVVGKDPFSGHPSLFAQPAGSSCGVHVDSFRTQFAQAVLKGRKRWTFWPLNDVDQICFLGRRDEVRLEVYRRRRMARFINYEQRFVRDAEGSVDDALLRYRVEVDVNAGETIFVPGGLAHQVVNLEDSIAVSQNFVDFHHAPDTILELRWPVPYDELADFLEMAIDESNSPSI